ncbi:MAG: hypothetical protein GPOALKHO_001235 [Sodalis sp.]|uniref:hypothetical protein n=1 Tax=Sodalis sp. (in: enterobacteria) TaxID=1898979 RepID=UPI0038732170|nr:MAG: hypothetical protein GPOALKHO_001235 [Sodalis sp.]
MLGSAGEPLSASASSDLQRNIVMWMDHRATREEEEINTHQCDKLLDLVDFSVESHRCRDFQRLHFDLQMELLRP